MLERTTHFLPAVEAMMRRLATADPAEVLGEIVCEHLDSGGKRLRARLALAATDALGGVADDAIAWAAACEILHNATLVHDDLQDGDRLRRGKETVWVRHGVPQAINAGDLLFELPFLAIGELQTSPAIQVALCVQLAHHAAAVIRGQAAEIELTSQIAVSPDHYLHAIEGKTSALFELPALGAALLAGLNEAKAREVTAPYRLLGMMFQMQDDVLDLFGDKGRDAVGSDLREGKISILVVEHLNAHPQDRAWLLKLLATARDETAQADVDEAIRRFADGGALAAALTRIQRLRQEFGDGVEAHGRRAWSELGNELSTLILKPIEHLL